MTEEYTKSESLKNLTRAVNTLRAEMDVAGTELGSLVVGASVSPQSSSYRTAIHVMPSGWVKLCGVFREYKCQVHGDYDQDKPWIERNFKLWFEYEEVQYFCLMTGKELLGYGCQLPADPADTIKRSGGVDKWLKAVQCTAV